MKHEDDWLREACASLAQEEADQLEQGLTDAEIRQAEAAYRRHRKAGLSLIRRKSARSSAAPYLKAAAVLALVIGAVSLSFRQAPLAKLPQAQPPTASVFPYFTDAPTIGPAAPPTDPPPTQPTERQDGLSTASPDHQVTPGAARVPTLRPMGGPDAAASETAVPLVQPTVFLPATSTPHPTATPSPSPAPALPEAENDNRLSPPEGWTGNYFPDVRPSVLNSTLDNSGIGSLDTGDGFQTASYRFGDSAALTPDTDQPQVSSVTGWDLRFTEYAASVIVSLPEDADVSYVRLADGVIALRTEADGGVTLTWDQEGQTLSLFCSGGDPLEIARSVKKLFDE